VSDYHHLFICTGSTCVGQGAEESLHALREELDARHIQHIRLTLCRCLGQCGNGPNMVIHGGSNPAQGTWYGHLVQNEIPSLVSQHLIKGETVSHLVITPVSDGG